MPTVTFRRFNPTPKLYEAAASGSAVEAGVSYDFDIDAHGDVVLWRDDRRVPAAHKAALRADVLAAHRAATAAPGAVSAPADRVLVALSDAIDRAGTAR